MAIKPWVLPHLQELKPYSNARAEFKGKASIWLDANENPFPREADEAYNRYPDPLQNELKKELAQLWGTQPERLFLGNGSDEPIDLLIRLFCAPGQDSIMVLEPTYSMYRQSAQINNVKCYGMPYHVDFEIDMEALKANIVAHQPKILFLCSPNNPSGTCIEAEVVEAACQHMEGIVVVDEAYIDFAPHKTALALLDRCENLVILRTLSKAWGLAALRLGAAIANPELIDYLNVIKPPYNINKYTQDYILDWIRNQQDRFAEERKQLLNQRKVLFDALDAMSVVKRIFRSEANFLLIRVQDPKHLYDYLIDKGIVVRNRHSQIPNTLRISVGTEQENATLLQAMENYSEPETPANND